MAWKAAVVLAVAAIVLVDEAATLHLSCAVARTHPGRHCGTYTCIASTL